MDTPSNNIDNEQWLSDGNCKLCRRRKYCTKPCKRCRLSTQRMVNSLITEKLDAATNGTFSEIMRRGYYNK